MNRRSFFGITIGTLLAPLFNKPKRWVGPKRAMVYFLTSDADVNRQNYDDHHAMRIEFWRPRYSALPLPMNGGPA